MRPAPDHHEASDPAHTPPAHATFRPASPAPPPRRPSRRLGRTSVVWIAAAAVLTAAVCTWLAVRNPGGSPTAAPEQGRVLPGAGDLPWPRDGQTAVEIEGRGRLTVHGDRAPVPIASVAKVMTAYVVLRDHPLRNGAAGPRITVDGRAAAESASRDESTVRVVTGSRLTERRLLELMLVPSANNVARLLARWDAGSEAAFVKRMNRAAAGLHMADTIYTGPSGVRADTRSTAADQLRLARAALRDDTLRRIASLRSVRTPDGPDRIRNTNTLLGENGVVGLKTGSSTDAGGALMWAAEAPRGTGTGGRGRLVVGVVLHQDAGRPPMAGLAAALDRSRRLVAAIRHALDARGGNGASTGPGGHGTPAARADGNGTAAPEAGAMPDTTAAGGAA